MGSGQKLAELFSAATFRLLSVPTMAADHVRSIVRQAGQPGLGRRMRVRHLFDRAYSQLLQSYRCEYVYKNAIATSLLLGRHSIDGPGAARLLSEFWVGQVKADVAVINGTSTVYEIKTELDDFKRLENQLKGYSSLFDRIYVVTTKSMTDSALELLPRHAGLLILNEQGELEVNRQARSNKECVNIRTIFLAMRQMEVLQYCHEEFGVSLELPNGVRAEECWTHFGKLSPSKAHDAMVKMVRRRTIHRAQRQLIDAVPNSLKHMALSKSLNVSQYERILGQLDIVV